MSVSLEPTHSNKQVTMDSLEKQLICPICLEMFTKPVVILPCQHNLCRKCASDLFQASNPYLPRRESSLMSASGRFRCPTCRHEVVLDRHGVYGLQRNLLVENIIDMLKQDTVSKGSKLEIQQKPKELMCELHKDEKINIYCVSCSVPTCSLCKVFGDHQSCEVAPLSTVYESQKTELSEGVALLVENNDRIQAIISMLEESCRTVENGGHRQKSHVCESFDHLYALLEERKAELTLKIHYKQQEKLDYIKGLQHRYTEHLDKSAKLVETGIQTMAVTDMAVFLQNTKSLLEQIAKSSNTSHLKILEQGYEKMDHFSMNLNRERKEILSIDFIADGDDDEVNVNNHVGENEIKEVNTSTAQKNCNLSPNAATVASEPVITAVESPAETSTSNSAHKTLITSPTPGTAQKPTSKTVENKSSPSTLSSPQIPSASAATEESSNSTAGSASESSDDGNQRHVFSFSWLNTP